jgi:beta-glucosidase
MRLPSVRKAAERWVRKLTRDRLRVQLLMEQLEDRCAMSATTVPVDNPGAVPVPQWNPANTPHTPSDVVWLGDSITDSYDGAPALPGYITAYGGQPELDLAVGGNKTQNVLWQVDEGELVGTNAKVVVVMIGTNNIATGDSPMATAQGVQAIVQAIEKSQPQADILLVGILPRGQSPSDPMRTAVSQTNSLIATLADGVRVHYVDIGAAFLNPDGTISPTVMSDYVHPTAYGYQIETQALSPTLDPLAGITPPAPKPPAPPPAPKPAPPPAQTQPTTETAPPPVKVTPAVEKPAPVPVKPTPPPVTPAVVTTPPAPIVTTPPPVVVVTTPPPAATDEAPSFTPSVTQTVSAPSDSSSVGDNTTPSDFSFTIDQPLPPPMPLETAQKTFAVGVSSEPVQSGLIAIEYLEDPAIVYAAVAV